jgi:hypothetical protein
MYAREMRRPTGGLRGPHYDHGHQLLAMVEAEVGPLIELLPVPILVTAGMGRAGLLLLNRCAQTQRSEADHRARTLHVDSPNLITTVGLALTGASLTIQCVVTVILAVLGGVVSAWFLLVEAP